MTTKIPVYAHIFGERFYVLKTDSNRVIAEPAVPVITQLIGHIIAPDRTLVWKGHNGIDIYRTIESFAAAADRIIKATARLDGPPYYRSYEGGRVLPESFDLAVAVYYAEHNMHDLTWESLIHTHAAAKETRAAAL